MAQNYYKQFRKNNNGYQHNDSQFFRGAFSYSNDGIFDCNSIEKGAVSGNYSSQVIVRGIIAR